MRMLAAAAAIAALATGCATRTGGHDHDAMHEKMHGDMHGEMHDRMHAEMHEKMHGTRAQGEGHDHAAMAPGATATLRPTQGNAAAGTVTFVQHGDHVMVTARVSGLQPGREHGFHAHEKGDCSSADGASAGGHFNPDGKPHGPQNGAHHAGDFPALKADAQGRAHVTFHLMGVSVGSGPADLLGRGLVVHANPDDYTTQPAGNAGARIACGVIGRPG